MTQNADSVGRMIDPWFEVTPGSLGRTAMHGDPIQAAVGLAAWLNGSTAATAVWFRAVADALDSIETYRLPDAQIERSGVVS